MKLILPPRASNRNDRCVMAITPYPEVKSPIPYVASMIPLARVRVNEFLPPVRIAASWRNCSRWQPQKIQVSEHVRDRLRATHAILWLPFFGNPTVLPVSLPVWLSPQPTPSAGQFVGRVESNVFTAVGKAPNRSWVGHAANVGQFQQAAVVLLHREP